MWPSMFFWAAASVPIFPLRREEHHRLSSPGALDDLGQQHAAACHQIADDAMSSIMVLDHLERRSLPSASSVVVT